MPASQGTQQGGLGGIRRISGPPGQACVQFYDGALNFCLVLHAVAY